MKTQEQILSFVKNEYINHTFKAHLFFDKWIESGDSVYREREFQYIGAAWECLRIIKEIEEGNDQKKFVCESKRD
jgi:hypothetical protein